MGAGVASSVWQALVWQVLAVVAVSCFRSTRFTRFHQVSPGFTRWEEMSED